MEAVRAKLGFGLIRLPLPVTEARDVTINCVGIVSFRFEEAGTGF